MTRIIRAVLLLLHSETMVEERPFWAVFGAQNTKGFSPGVKRRMVDTHSETLYCIPCILRNKCHNHLPPPKASAAVIRTTITSVTREDFLLIRKCLPHRDLRRRPRRQKTGNRSKEN